MKKCTKCKEVKQLTDFSKSKNHKDGLQYECKSCKAEYAKHFYERMKFDSLYKLYIQFKNSDKSSV